MYAAWLICTECNTNYASVVIYAPYWINDNGDKKSLAHPGDGFCYTGLKRKYGEEIADKRYGHETSYWDIKNERLVNRDANKDDIDDVMSITQALDMGLIKCAKCGEQVVFGAGFMS